MHLRMREGRLLHFFVVTLLLALLLLIFLLWPYNVQNFRGDGQLADAGYWSFPRYRITFDPISINQTGQQDYRFSGQPATPLTLSLQFNGDRTNVIRRHASTRIDATLSTPDGQFCTQAGGKIDQWKIAISGDHVELWHPGLREINLPQHKSITLSIVVTSTAPSSPPIAVQPILSGGGNELP